MRDTTACQGSMTDDTEDLATLDAAISRAMRELETGNPDPDIREKLEKELAILAEIRLKIAGRAAVEA
jgi:hypothetical protein